MMKRLILRREVKEHAIKVLQKAYLLTQTIKRIPRNQKEINKSQNAYRSSLVMFSQQTSQLRSIEIAQKRSQSEHQFLWDMAKAIEEEVDVF